jgi:hypothetical protein
MESACTGTMARSTAGWSDRPAYGPSFTFKAPELPIRYDAEAICRSPFDLPLLMIALSMAVKDATVFGQNGTNYSLIFCH